MKREFFTARDGKKISICIWDEVEEPKGVVQILHGMSEHIARYDGFASYLNEQGYVVFGDDHRAHGYTDPDNLGLAEEGKNLFEDTVSDAKELSVWAKEKYGKKVVLFGHSYGSFLAQRYISYGTQDICGVVLCGSAFMSGLIVSASVLLTKGKDKKEKKDLPGDMFASMTFKSYDKAYKDGLNAWLNRDKSEVEKYNADPLCGFTCSNGFYYYFFRGLKSIEKASHSNTPKDFPILIISGSDDHVGSCGKLAVSLANHYHKLGFTPELILYENGRHEILLGPDKQKVFDDVSSFVSDCLNK